MKKIILITIFLVRTICAQEAVGISATEEQAVAATQEMANLVSAEEMMEAGMSLDEIEDYLKTLSQDFDAMSAGGGGMDSGGGDAVIMTYCKSMGCLRKGLRLYSLDLAENGIQKDLSINYSYQNGETIYVSDATDYILNLKGAVEHTIANRGLFNQLLEYDGIFGQEVRPSSSDLENSAQLWSLGKEIRELGDQRWTIIRDGATNTKEIDQDLLDSIDQKIEELRKVYNPLIEKRREEVAGRYFGHDTKIAVGLVNKIEEIRAVDSDFAQLIEDTLLDLEWLVVDLPIKELNDEGEIPVIVDHKIQIATRKNGIVRLAKEGWEKHFQFNDNWIDTLTIENKIAVVMHEVLYEITKRQGDYTSERARNANARLFMTSRPQRNIRKAADFILRR